MVTVIYGNNHHVATPILWQPVFVVSQVDPLFEKKKLLRKVNAQAEQTAADSSASTHAHCDATTLRQSKSRRFESYTTTANLAIQMYTVRVPCVWSTSTYRRHQVELESHRDDVESNDSGNAQVEILAGDDSVQQ